MPAMSVVVTFVNAPSIVGAHRGRGDLAAVRRGHQFREALQGERRGGGPRRRDRDHGRHRWPGWFGGGHGDGLRCGVDGWGGGVGHGVRSSQVVEYRAGGGDVHDDGVVERAERQEGGVMPLPGVDHQHVVVVVEFGRVDPDREHAEYAVGGEDQGVVAVADTGHGDGSFHAAIGRRVRGRAADRPAVMAERHDRPGGGIQTARGEADALAVSDGADLVPRHRDPADRAARPGRVGFGGDEGGGRVEGDDHAVLPSKSRGRPGPLGEAGGAGTAGVL